MHDFSSTGKFPSPLYALADQLVETWASALLNLQEKNKSKVNYGGIVCPTYKAVHGRVGDTIYPFLYMANKTKQRKYLDAALLLYDWMEHNVSQDDGSWLNEPVNGSWKGTTIFTIIALCETIKHHGSIMDPAFHDKLITRLKKAGDYVYNNFTVDYGNINYPIAASYGLSLLGELTGIQKFSNKGRTLAHQTLAFITPINKFIYGEGDHQRSKKGCYAIDLGYNVEESLPSLVLYGLLRNDNEVLEAAVQSMQAHMEFMLPDGGWDNSWGTRSYKWTYWGSRTSDGCQPAYALLADRDIRFYKVALRNTELLHRTTKNGLLYGGPHYSSHGIMPSVHHTFCHIKALTTILDHKPSTIAEYADEKVSLPRETDFGVKFFNDVQTALVAAGDFKATVTGYDKEYKNTKDGHATGGALTMLWHANAGVVCSGSMNEYQLIESGNMQADPDPLSICLTPRIELRLGGKVYTNISDLDATMDITEDRDMIEITSTARLVDKDQNNPLSGEVKSVVLYKFTRNKVSLNFNCEYEGDIKVILPVISPSTDEINIITDNEISIKKPTSLLIVTADKPILCFPSTAERVFNYVPGLEAVPCFVNSSKAKIEIVVKM